MTTTKISKTKRSRIFERDKGECQICHRKLKLESENVFDKDLAHIDHIKPRSLGGKNDDGNLRVLCSKCNTSRGNITGEKLVKIAIKSVQIPFEDKFFNKISKEAELGFITVEDIKEIEANLIKSFNKNIEALHQLEKRLTKF